MSIKRSLGKKVLDYSKSYQFYSKKYSDLAKNQKELYDTINNLESLNKENMELINEKERQIRELQNKNKKLTQQIQENNQQTEKTTKTHNQQIQEKNTQIKKLQNKNKKLTQQIQENNQQTEKILKILTSNHKHAKKILSILKNDKQLQLHYIEKNLNYLTIKINSKYNETERLLESNLSKMQRRIGTYLITIIIPVYNVEKYLEKCFLSLLRQTIGFNNLEIIFIDDCSTDNSYSILREFNENYSNVRVFKTEKNSGSPSKPRNMGMEYATSNYVMFLDPDDFYYENSCEILYEKIVETESNFVSGLHSRMINDVDKGTHKGLLLSTFTDSNLSKKERILQLKKFNKKYPEEIIIENINELPYILGNHSVQSKIFNLSFLRENNIKFPEGLLGEDSVFLYKSLVCADKFAFIKKPIFTYYERKDINNKSLCQSINDNQQITRLKSYNMIYEISKEKNLEEITIKHLINAKIIYFFKTYVINKNLADEDLINIFNESKKLCQLMLNKNIPLNSKFEELFSNIVNDKYDEAIALCK